jgi:hypothetical protein
VVITTWERTTAGVLRLPSGRLVRGRGLRRPPPAGPLPAFALYLLGHQPPPVAWESRWLHWPDFWLPSDRAATAAALREAWTRAEAERVESPAPAATVEPVRRWPVWRCWTGSPAARQSPMSRSITLHARWRRPGNAALSPASSSGRSQQPELGGVLDEVEVASLLDRGFCGLAKTRQHWHARSGSPHHRPA